MARKTEKQKTEKPISEKQAKGTLYQIKPGGRFYFRYQINGGRKNIGLKTSDYDEAKKKLANILPTITTSSIEVVAAHVKQAKGLEGYHRKTLALPDAWQVYSTHPDRAMPATVSEQLSYKTTFSEFVALVASPLIEMHEVSYKHALAFSDYLKGKSLAVDTHNRKMKRLRKIFRVLHDYCGDTPNPFVSPTLFRKNREEQNLKVRRLSFTREQEQLLLKVLDDPKKKVMHKKEIRVIFFLGLYTGQRLKDCVQLRWNRINLQQRTIEVKQFKTGKEVSIPIAPQLYDVLVEAASWRQDQTDFLCPNVAARYNQEDAQGKNVGNNLVNIDVLRVIKWIGVQPSVAVEGRKKAVTVYGFHSLRHSFASHCAEAGVPKAVVLSILGTDSEIVDKYYTHISTEAQHKAMTAIAGEIGVLSPQDKIDRTVAYLNTLEATDKLDEIRRLLTEN